ncbi:MAG: bifunctional hydroxymethylpyrimidine kinase/phosphomethylpyrimidine kinase [Prevotellaceae bacterium]|jgi:hydroxymethylpyrimidine/phosphomethylpyrimidine kinase|nr:bifunctional hydroxymethylpyrimidine kinase/phosphomethylpyrimidine kinase [Prevotellaceae bacterium]
MSTTSRYTTALTIAGSDSGGCAGIQADLKTFSALGVFGASVITAVTAQNTVEVRAVEALSPAIIRQQLEAVLDDMPVDAVKTGMLPSPEIIEVVAEAIDRYALKCVVVDPVMVATSGARLAAASVVEAFRKNLYRRVSLITPNVPEAEALSGKAIRTEEDFREAAEIMLGEGCPAVLVKGGHLSSACATDTLFRQGREAVSFSSPRIATANLHGTGCTFSSAIAAHLAQGLELEDAVRAAKACISAAIRAGSERTLGKGYGPVNHLHIYDHFTKR